MTTKQTYSWNESAAALGAACLIVIAGFIGFWLWAMVPANEIRHGDEPVVLLTYVALPPSLLMLVLATPLLIWSVRSKKVPLSRAMKAFLLITYLVAGYFNLYVVAKVWLKI